MTSSDGLDQTLTPEQARALSDTAVADSMPTSPSSEAAPLSLTHYQLGDVLGRGGMGEVWLASDLEIGRDVAIKRMRSASPSAEATARFLREARIQARLDHPAIVPVHSIGRDDHGRPYFTMKRLSGTTLHDVLATGREPLQRLLRAVVDVCLAIEFAHDRGFIHRDLKPSNVMLGEYGEVYVLDWGVARQVGELPDAPGPTDIASLGGETEIGAVLGTPGYMSPEQLRGDEVGPATDVYALGAILFEVLAGEPVHPRGQPAIASTLAAGELSPARRAPDRKIGFELDRLAVAALAADAATRPTARALADGIQRFLDGDRDLDARRKLAAELVTTAREAIASGDPDRRATAFKSAGHAMALDPESEAAELVTGLMIEPPQVLPAGLLHRLDEVDGENIRMQGKLAVFSMMSYFALGPIVLWMGIRDWTWFGALVLMILAAAGSAYTISRRHGAYVWLSLVLNAVIVMLLSRLTSPFLLLPGIAAGSAAAFAAFPRLLHRPWLVIGSYIVAMLTPVALEAAGVWTTTWQIEGGRYLGMPSGVDFDGLPAEIFLVVGSAAIVVVLALFVRTLSLSQRAGRRQLEIQAWHLHQLIPPS